MAIKAELFASSFMVFILITCTNAMDSQVYIVTVDGTPAIHKFPRSAESPRAFPSSTRSEMLAYTSELVARHDDLLSSTFTSSSYRKLYSYSHVLNGFAVKLRPKQADDLRNSQGVRHVEADWRLKKLTTHTPDFLGLPTGAWPRDGGPSNAGENVVIGIIDTGIDPTHPSFSARGPVPYPPLANFHGKCETSAGSSVPLCNGKIIAAQHFAAAAQAAGAFNASNDLASPVDEDGHGSHTASIAAGNHGVFVNSDGFYFGEASGMAPRARISVYKALYRHFGGFMSDVVAAIDQATKDGVDVLSLSVGPSSPPSSTRFAYLSAFDVALLSAVKAGVFVAQAAGNGGPYPRTMASFSPWIMSVAAGLDDRNYSNWIYLGNGARLAGLGLAPATPGEQMYDLVLAEDAAVANNSGFSFSPSNCQQPEVLNKAFVQGKILMCTYSFSFLYGGATVRKVADTAKSLSAVGFVLFVTRELPGNKFNPIPLGMPGVVITDVQDSTSLLNYYNSSSAGSAARAKIGNGMSPTYEGTGPQVAIYSSRGPGVKDYTLRDSDVLKPNILGPGSLIWGAWTPSSMDEPDFQGQRFAMISGTSMATPHIAGVAALIKQAHPDWSPGAIASAMMTTASVADKNGKQLLAQHYSSTGSIILNPATPFDIGGGAINPSAALDPGLVFKAEYEDYIGFLCSIAQMDQTQVLNVTGSSCTKSKSAADLNSPSITISNLVAHRIITRTVTNVAAAIETYKVSYVEPEGIAMQVSPSLFTIQGGQSVTLSVTLKVAAPITGEYSFGSMLLSGDKGHAVRIPLAVRAGAG
ncbi:hypothetical protein KP509_22G004300 [Ceratopteris richardii]|uniref:Uncharacterized protein n=1 Tax=Ceratopteris richardii TaxID=49495 RepID=A0A8T2S5G7_CERRI|nr:hypothetical protein KP509_22G004300 [Ceratopteris richardii]KAH7306263.1 hypothetical protein KP509_22G004300 [Ceratopteris richardii]KAH7306264.1 hypothetical protein KP509_22G004300 [Ceratopteris richardii]KAH7306265.1 hypothetical protein KP509_22G004300 [Ceratopteris richardii]